MLQFEIFLWYVMLFTPLVWGLRLINWTAAAVFLISVNTVLIWIFSPLLLAYLLGQFLFVLVLHHVKPLVPERFRSGYLWLAFLGLVPVNFASSFVGLPYFPQFEELLGGPALRGIFWTLGATFFVLKSFIILKEAEKLTRFPWIGSMLSLTFVPSFSAGPIAGSSVWQKSSWAEQISFAQVGEAVMKVGWGAAALYVLSPLFKSTTLPPVLAPISELVMVYTSFAGLFFDFAGYSLMAIGAAALMGVTLPVNFNRPYLATSIRDFWRRWHMSLSAFIGTYLFKPFVRATGSQRWGIFLAFVCAGIWHEFSLAYLIWGIGHGAALSINTKVPGWWVRAMAALPNWLSVAISWFLTMTWVAILSRLATQWIGI